MVAKLILQYLLAHPNAKDTRDGVIRWWLPGGVETWDVGKVQGVLDRLVAQGWLTTRTVTPSQVLYGLATERLDDVTAYVHEQSGNGKDVTS